MKLSVDIVLTQNDTVYVKGEELDSELTSQLENIELDGWEVASVDIRRGKPVKIDKSGIRECLLLLRNTAMQLDDPWHENPAEFTNRQILTMYLNDMV